MPTHRYSGVGMSSASNVARLRPLPAMLDGARPLRCHADTATPASASLQQATWHGCVRWQPCWTARVHSGAMPTPVLRGRHVFSKQCGMAASVGSHVRAGCHCDGRCVAMLFPPTGVLATAPAPCSTPLIRHRNVFLKQCGMGFQPVPVFLRASSPEQPLFARSRIPVTSSPTPATISRWSPVGWRCIFAARRPRVADSVNRAALRRSLRGGKFVMTTLPSQPASRLSESRTKTCRPRSTSIDMARSQRFGRSLASSGRHRPWGCRFRNLCRDTLAL